AGSAATDLGRVNRQGAMQITEQPLDIALAGPGYFQVTGRTGEQLLTRDGHLQLDVRGRLGTTTGQLLTPAITVPADADPAKLSIAANGVVEYDGRRLGQIRIVEVPSP